MCFAGLEHGDQAYHMDQLQIGPEGELSGGFREEAVDRQKFLAHGLREVGRVSSLFPLDESNCVGDGRLVERRWRLVIVGELFGALSGGVPCLANNLRERRPGLRGQRGDSFHRRDRWQDDLDIVPRCIGL